MGKARKRFRLGSVSIGCAAASFLIFGQAGAAHAPLTSSASSATPAVASSVLPATTSHNADSERFSAAPFKKLKVRVRPAALKLTPTLGESSYAALELGALRYPDGAVALPGRSKPQAEPEHEINPAEVGHAVSVPTAVRMADTFRMYDEQDRTPERDVWRPAFAGLPLVSSAHAADPSPQHAGMGGPISRLPIEGHILFEKDNVALSRQAQMQLEKLLQTLRGSHARLEIMAYAGRQGSNSSESRRLSLRRGLAVRAYLVSRGIDQKRITVRPLGGVRDDGPQARVDVFYASY